MKAILTSACCAVLIGGSALADTCWHRTYGDDHLAQHRNQTVRALTVRLPDRQELQARGEQGAMAWARFRDSSQRFQGPLICQPPKADMPENAWSCCVECDGGRFVAWPSGPDAILLRTRGGFMISDGCGEGDMRWVRDDDAAQTTFKLYRSECPG